MSHGPSNPKVRIYDAYGNPFTADDLANTARDLKRMRRIMEEQDPATEATLDLIRTNTKTAADNSEMIVAQLPESIGQRMMDDSLGVAIASNQSPIQVEPQGALVFKEDFSYATVSTDSLGGSGNVGQWYVAAVGSQTKIGSGCVLFQTNNVGGNDSYLASRRVFGKYGYGPSGIRLYFSMRFSASISFNVGFGKASFQSLPAFGVTGVNYLLDNATNQVSASLPSDGEWHRYSIWLRRDQIDWYIDDMNTPLYTATLGPTQLANAPFAAATTSVGIRYSGTRIVFHCILGLSTTLSAEITNICLVEPSRTATVICDPDAPDFQMGIDPSRGAAQSPAERYAALKGYRGYEVSSSRTVTGKVTTSAVTTVHVRTANWVAAAANAPTGTVVSSSTSDTSAGVGARTIRITYIDSTGNRNTVDVTMNGTSNVTVNFPTNFAQAESMDVLTTGSTLWNVGNITLTVSAAVRMQIAAIDSSSRYAVVLVPKSSLVAITSLRLSTTIASTVRFFLEGSAITGMMPLGEVRVPANAIQYVPLNVPIVVENPSDNFRTIVAYLTPDATTANTTSVSMDAIEFNAQAIANYYE